MQIFCESKIILENVISALNKEFSGSHYFKPSTRISEFIGKLAKDVQHNESVIKKIKLLFSLYSNLILFKSKRSILAQGLRKGTSVKPHQQYLGASVTNDDAPQPLRS